MAWYRLLLAELARTDDLSFAYYHKHDFHGLFADPFMGGGTTLMEANHLGFDVIGADINPMAYWIVRQEVSALDDHSFVREAARVSACVASTLSGLYTTACTRCESKAAVKYFLWVKTQDCPSCGVNNDLFPGYLLAEAVRHPKNVVACSACGSLVECSTQPRRNAPVSCPTCNGPVFVEGSARRNVTTCRACARPFRYPEGTANPPRHRMWAIEYHCVACKPGHDGRFFKAPDAQDLANIVHATELLSEQSDIRLPSDSILSGDETDRLHRWGYRQWRDLFNS